MLYIFTNNNGVEIAWNSRAPKHAVESRTSQLDTRFSLRGLIRTISLG